MKPKELNLDDALNLLYTEKNPRVRVDLGDSEETLDTNALRVLLILRSSKPSARSLVVMRKYGRGHHAETIKTTLEPFGLAEREEKKDIHDTYIITKKAEEATYLIYPSGV